MSTPEQRQEFINSIYPAAVRIGQETGMSWELILAQTAQETGWGQRVLPGTNNIFNIKANGGWDGESRVFNVPEERNGRTVMENHAFRVYDSVDDALRDRVQFLRENPRYANAGLFQPGTLGDPRGEAEALQRAGYATDSAYADNLMRVLQGPAMRTAIAGARAANPGLEDGTAPARPAPDAPGVAAPGATAPRPPAGGTAAPAVAMADGVLRPGESGPEVRQLQLALRERGYELTGTGNYRERTEASVRDFQRREGLTVDGLAGPQTLRALGLQELLPERLRTGARPADAALSDGVLEHGERGESVRRVQLALRERGYELTGTGNFQDRTEAAVRDFQRRQGLTVDGDVGPQTLRALGLNDMIRERPAASRPAADAPAADRPAAERPAAPPAGARGNAYEAANRYFMGDPAAWEYGRGDRSWANPREGGNGRTDDSRTERDVDRDGRRGVDCSTFVWRGLHEAGYDVAGRFGRQGDFSTRSLFNGTEVTARARENFDVISAADARRPNGDLQPGDLLMWRSRGGSGQHVGVFGGYDSEGRITFIGSQISTGPGRETIRPGGYWDGGTMEITGALRPRESFRTQGVAERAPGEVAPVERGAPITGDRDPRGLPQTEQTPTPRPRLETVPPERTPQEEYGPRPGDRAPGTGAGATILVSSPLHPENARHTECFGHLRRLGLEMDPAALERLSATLSAESLRAGLPRVTDVVASRDGSTVFALAGRPDDPASLRCSVDRHAATAQPVEASTREIDAERERMALLMRQPSETPALRGPMLA